MVDCRCRFESPSEDLGADGDHQVELLVPSCKPMAVASSNCLSEGGCHEDGFIRVEVRNSPDVDVGYGQDYHRVELTIGD